MFESAWQIWMMLSGVMLLIEIKLGTSILLMMGISALIIGITTGFVVMSPLLQLFVWVVLCIILIGIRRVSRFTAN